MTIIMLVVIGQNVSAQKYASRVDATLADTVGLLVISMTSDSLVQIEPTLRVRELIVCVVFSGRDGQETREYVDLIAGSPVWINLKKYRYQITVIDGSVLIEISFRWIGWFQQLKKLSRVITMFAWCLESVFVVLTHKPDSVWWYISLVIPMGRFVHDFSGENTLAPAMVYHS